MKVKVFGFRIHQGAKLESEGVTIVAPIRASNGGIDEDAAVSWFCMGCGLARCRDNLLRNTPWREVLEAVGIARCRECLQIEAEPGLLLRLRAEVKGLEAEEPLVLKRVAELLRLEGAPSSLLSHDLEAVGAILTKGRDIVVADEAAARALAELLGTDVVGVPALVGGTQVALYLTVRLSKVVERTVDQRLRQARREVRRLEPVALARRTRSDNDAALEALAAESPTGALCVRCHMPAGYRWRQGKPLAVCLPCATLEEKGRDPRQFLRPLLAR